MVVFIVMARLRCALLPLNTTIAIALHKPDRDF